MRFLSVMGLCAQMERHLNRASKLKSYFGEFSAGIKFLDSKPDRSPWILLKLIDAILRGIAQVCFANNPISGLLILIGLGIAGYEFVIGALLGPFVAIVTCIILDQPRANIENGLYQFNACLVGTVIPSLYPLLYNGDLGYMTWIVVIVMSAISVPVQSGLANILSGLTANFRKRTPANTSLENPDGNKETRVETKMEPRSLVGLTFPFNIVTTVAIFFLISYKNVPKEPSVTEHVENDAIVWAEVFKGILVSSGQVYAAYTPIGSILMYIGFALYSPLLAVVSVLGATIGTFTALLFTSFSYSLAYDGIWGYSTVLTAGALGCTFYEQNWRTVVMWVLACIFTVGVQGVLAQSFATIGVPIFTFPFVLTTWGFMILNAENHTLIRR